MNAPRMQVWRVAYLNGPRLRAGRASFDLLVAFAVVAGLLLAPAVPAQAAIGHANLDGTGVDEGFVTTWATTYDVAVDAGHLYWTWSVDDDPFGASIGRANLDGTGVDQGFITGIGPGGVAVGADHIYWTSAGTQSIGRANLDGTGVELLWLKSVGERPLDIEVNATHVYWAWASGGQVGPQSAFIGRANLDGTGADRDFIGPIELGSNTALALDAAHVYWGGAGSSFARANLDGTAITPEFVQAPGYDLAVGGGQILFSAAGIPSGREVVNGIGRANVDGSAPNPFFIPNLATPPLGIALGPADIYWSTLDTDPPETKLTKEAPDRTKRHEVKFKFTSDEPGSTFKCRLDDKRVRPCSSPKKVKSLDEGKHRFEVRAFDAAGNRDPTPAKDRFKVVP